MKKQAMYALVLSVSLVAAPAAFGQPLQLRFTPGEGRGTCWVMFPGGQLPGTQTPYRTRFSMRVSDGNLVTEILVNGWKTAQDNASSDKVRPMTLTFDTGKTTTSRSGGYDSGFDDGAWGGWGAGPTSDAAVAMLKQAKTVRIKFDGQDFGVTDLQLKGLATTSLDECLKRKRAAAQ